MAEVIQNSLQAGALTPDSLIDILGARGLAEHMPHELVWRITVSAVDPASLEGDSEPTLQLRTFLGAVLDSALDLEIVTPPGILVHTTPALIMEFLPIQLRAEVLERCLDAKHTTPELVLDVITAPVLAEHLPALAIWEAIGTYDRDDVTSDSASPDDDGKLETEQEEVDSVEIDLSDMGSDEMSLDDIDSDEVSLDDIDSGEPLEVDSVEISAEDLDSEVDLTATPTPLKNASPPRRKITPAPARRRLRTSD